METFFVLKESISLLGRLHRRCKSGLEKETREVLPVVILNACLETEPDKTNP